MEKALNGPKDVYTSNRAIFTAIIYTYSWLQLTKLFK